MGEPTPYSVAILVGLTVTNKHVYTGTVTEKVKARRRAKNKVARQSRKSNR